MAENSIVDVKNEPGDLGGLEKSLREAVTAQHTQVQQQAADEAAANKEVKDDPLAGTKFEGKSLEDILDSYKNLESLYGRMANDLGVQRKLTDRLLDLKRDDDLQRNVPPVTVDSTQLLDNPTEALDKWYADRDSKSKQTLQERLDRFEATLAEQRFTAKHPDYMQVGQSQDFQAWATKSPSRSRVAQLAAQGDLEAADALFTEYKEVQKSNPPANNSNNQANSQAAIEEARKAGFESGNSGGEGSSKRMYRRADLIDLKIRKPDVYADPEFQKEILKAYSEGRVK